MTFFSLLSTAASSFFYGIVVTAVIMAVLYAVLRSLSRGIVQTPVFYITGVILAILLIIQFSMMIGAMQAKDAADSAKIYISQLVEGYNGTVSAQDSQKVMDAVTERFPVVGSFLNIADFSGHDISELPETMHETMTNYLSSYIWHRVWWILGIIVVTIFIVLLFDKPGSTQTRRVLTDRYKGRRLHTSGHRRISRVRK